MLRNMTERRRVKVVDYCIEFLHPGGNDGYSFPCDERGNLLPMEDCAKANYDYCMAHPEEFETWNEVVSYVRRYTENATGTCVCGATVELYDQYMGACECPGCGRWYNLFGQSLLPPDQWVDGADW